MKYLILGSSGFIGSNLVKEILQNRDNEMTLFDIKIKDNTMERCNFIESSFTEDCDFDSIVKGHDCVIHLISTTIPNSGISYDKEISENVFPTLKLLDACIKYNVKIVFISSGGTIYGKSDGKSPFKETDVVKPICSYGIQKAIIENYLYLYADKYGLKYNVIRLSNPYGPGQNPNGKVGVVSVFFYRLIHNMPITMYGDGNVIRDYIYIADVVKGIVNIANYNGEQRVFNLGSGIETSLNDIVLTIQNELNIEANVNCQEKRDDDLHYSVLDVTKYHDAFPNHNFISIENGIHLLNEFYKSR